MVTEKTTLSDLIDATGGSIQTGPFGTKLKASEYTTTGVPVISVGEVGFGRIRLHDRTPKVDESICKRMPQYLLKTDDIVFGRKGAVERSAHVQPDENGYFLGSDGIRVRLNPEKCDPRFIAYQLQTEKHREWMIQHAAGTTMPSLNEGIIRRIPIVLPPLPEQKAIAHILGSLDDKIELNRRMNETLEGMAQALFKSWFIDFDPVIDNSLVAGNPIPDEFADRAEVRRQALADGTANRDLSAVASAKEEAAKLFPAAFQQTEAMGWIPEGWEVSTIGDEVPAVGGGTPSTKNEMFWNGDHPFCTPKDMSKLSSLVLLDTERHLTDSGAKNVSSGILPAGTLLLSSRAPIGYLAIAEIPVTVNQGIIALLKNKTYHPMFLLSWLRSNMEKIVERANGSTFLEISKKNFKTIPFLRPSEDSLALFNSQAETIHRKIVISINNTNHLTKLRDSLLPKLISGELRVSEAEQPMEVVK